MKARSAVLARDGQRCAHCSNVFETGELDVHHRVPRSMGGSDELANLITLCDGCHGAVHPNLQASLSRRFLERWAMRLARLLDSGYVLPESTEHLGSILRELGLSKFRDNQLIVVLTALRGESVLFVSPTGSGKSLCFQVPALLRPGIALIISPLKALMRDQVSGLQKKMIASSFINGDLSPHEKELRYTLLENRALKFLFCAPERFDPTMVRPEEVNRLTAFAPSYFVVDEAHCIDRWGRDFRPNYSRLGSVRKLLKDPPVLAFTATAGRMTQQHILESLGIPNAKVLVTGVDRPNIGLVRIEMEGEKQRVILIKSLLRALPTGKAMIFVPTVKIGSHLEEQMKGAGLAVPFYHANLGNSNDRDNLLGQFTGRIEPSVRFIICTNAFGMGIDVPDVRLVIHLQHPASVEDYFQEVGRAGRDGGQSLAVVFTSRGKDKGLLQYMASKTVENIVASATDRKMALEAKFRQIDEVHGLVTDHRSCFRRSIIRYFQEERRERKPWALRIVEWLFSVRQRPVRSRLCCDHCDSINERNIQKKFESIFAA